MTPDSRRVKQTDHRRKPTTNGAGPEFREETVARGASNCDSVVDMADIRFGTFLAPNMLPTYQAIADAVGERLGLSTELVVETDYENCRNDVKDICFVCSLQYVMFEREGISPAVPIAAPVLAGERYGGRPIYFSDVMCTRTAAPSPFSICVEGPGRSTTRSRSLARAPRAITWSRLERRTDSF